MLNQCEISVEHYWHGFLWSSSQFFTIRDNKKKLLLLYLRKCLCLLVEYVKRNSSEPIGFLLTVAFFAADAVKRFVCYFLGVSFVEDLFQ